MQCNIITSISDKYNITNHTASQQQPLTAISSA